MKNVLVHRLTLAGAAIGSLLAAISLGVASAQGPGAGGGKPAVIATVRLDTVMEKLDQRAEAQANLSALRQQAIGEDKTRKAEIEKLQTQLEEMRKAAGDTPPTREMMALQEDFALKSLRYQAWSRFTLDKVDIEMALLMQDLYRNIKIAAGQMASANGYDLVLVDDSAGEISTSAEARVPREAQVMQQIAGRRMLHVNAGLDITDELITRMNNAHKAGAGGAAGAGGTGGATKPAAGGGAPRP